MRYIYAVAGLIFIIVGISGITFLKTGPPASKELARVNKRIITVDEFNKVLQENRTVSSYRDKKGTLDDLLTREILIQEAKSRGLDLREPFRRSIQNYYEQTLLKNLTQEKMSEIRVSISEQEIEEYYRNMGKTYELSIAVLPTEAEANQAIAGFPVRTAEKRRLQMEEIPPELSIALGALKVGEVSKKPVPCGGLICDTGFFVFRVERLTSEAVQPLAMVRDEIKKTLEERKRRAEMQKWLDGLKTKSDITINEALLK